MKDILIRLLSNLRKSAKSADHLFLLFFSVVFSADADEPFFKKNDVIALVGGEDMVAMSEYGYLELLLQRALPDYHLKFRDLAWEGDTVFEQHRDLNFPPLEAQLDQVGATVVLCQFGQMESLGKRGTGNAERGNEAAKGEIKEFIAAYEKLIARMSGGGKRRVFALPPVFVTEAVPVPHKATVEEKTGAAYRDAVERLATAKKQHYLPVSDIGQGDSEVVRANHLTRLGHFQLAWQIGYKTSIPNHDAILGDSSDSLDKSPLLKIIRAKNRLWFNYWRVQNWAFLAGDRTEQPSSRDHVDRTRRWFPAEREKFLPLIEKKEQEIWALAAKLAEQK